VLLDEEAYNSPMDRKTAKAEWICAWQELPQQRIREWIERIMHHVKEVILLEGGNEYEEGRTGEDSTTWKGKRIKGQLPKRALWEQVDEANITISRDINSFDFDGGTILSTVSED
jgi:hypothetical protein